jgi:site-specific recombinase XerD
MLAGRELSESALEGRVDGFLTYLRAVRNVSPNTLQGYATDLAQFFAFLGRSGQGPELGHLTISRFLAELRGEGHSAPTVARKLSALRSFFRYLCREGVLADNPAASVTSPRLERRLPRYLHLGEVKRLLELPDRSPQGLRDRAVLEVLYATGARIGEVRRLNIEDVDIEAESVRVAGPGRKERSVSCGSHARSALRDYLTQARPVFLRAAGGAAADGRQGHSSRTDLRALFLNRRGGRLSARGLRRLVDKYLTRMALGLGVSPGSLRHSFAANLLDEGADISVVQEMLGHAGLSATRAYSQVSQARLRAVYWSAHPRARKEARVDAKGDDDPSR